MIITSCEIILAVAATLGCAPAQGNWATEDSGQVSVFIPQCLTSTGFCPTPSQDATLAASGDNFKCQTDAIGRCTWHSIQPETSFGEFMGFKSHLAIVMAVVATLQDTVGAESLAVESSVDNTAPRGTEIDMLNKNVSAIATFAVTFLATNGATVGDSLMMKNRILVAMFADAIMGCNHITGANCTGAKVAPASATDGQGHWEVSTVGERSHLHTVKQWGNRRLRRQRAGVRAQWRARCAAIAAEQAGRKAAKAARVAKAQAAKAAKAAVRQEMRAIERAWFLAQRAMQRALRSCIPQVQSCVTASTTTATACTTGPWESCTTEGRKVEAQAAVKRPWYKSALPGPKARPNRVNGLTKVKTVVAAAQARPTRDELSKDELWVKWAYAQIEKDWRANVDVAYQLSKELERKEKTGILGEEYLREQAILRAEAREAAQQQRQTERKAARQTKEEFRQKHRELWEATRPPAVRPKTAATTAPAAPATTEKRKPGRPAKAATVAEPPVAAVVAPVVVEKQVAPAPVKEAPAACADGLTCGEANTCETPVLPVLTSAEIARFLVEEIELTLDGTEANGDVEVAAAEPLSEPEEEATAEPDADTTPEPDVTPDTGPTTETVCNDEVDNHGDGLADCQVANTIAWQVCQEPTWIWFQTRDRNGFLNDPPENPCAGEESTQTPQAQLEPLCPDAVETDKGDRYGLAFVPVCFVMEARLQGKGVMETMEAAFEYVRQGNHLAASGIFRHLALAQGEFWQEADGCWRSLYLGTPDFSWIKEKEEMFTRKCAPIKLRLKVREIQEATAGMIEPAIDAIVDAIMAKPVEPTWNWPVDPDQQRHMATRVDHEESSECYAARIDSMNKARAEYREALAAAEAEQKEWKEIHETAWHSAIKAAANLLPGNRWSTHHGIETWKLANYSAGNRSQLREEVSYSVYSWVKHSQEDAIFQTEMFIQNRQGEWTPEGKVIATRENAGYAYGLILPALAPVMGLDVNPLMALAVFAMAWLITKISPSFGGFALTLLAGATGCVVATVTGQEADSLQEEEQQGNQPHTDQEGLMVEENVEVANDRATELLGTTKADLMGSLRTKKRASLYAGLAKAAATSMVKVLLGEGVSLQKTSEAMFEWPGLKPEYRKAAYKAHVDSMQPDGAKACQRELKLKEHYGVSLFEGNGTLEDYKHSLHHIHRTPGSAATIEMYDIIERGLKSLAENNDLQAVTIGELAKAWVTLNLIQTNFASEVIALEPMSESQTYLMLNALSKTSFNTIRVKHMAELEKQIKGKGGDGVTGCPTDIFLLYRNAGVLIADGKYNGFDMGSMAYRVRKFTSASKAAKAQKYISQYFAPNLLGGQVIDFAREYTLGKYTFTLKSVSESVLVVKPVSGKSVFENETAKELADNIYDGVVFVSRRFMALVLPGHVDEIAAGKLDGKVLIGRAYGFNFLIKGGFVIMPPDFIKCTGKDMIAYGSKDEICPTWSENRLTVIINSGVPKSDKGACTDTQTLINGFDLKDKHVQRIFTQIKDDAVEHLRQRLDDVRKGKIQMAELESDILDVMDMDDDEKASDEVLSQLRDSSRLKEIIGAVGYAAGSGMALPQLIAPTMNQMTNQAMDPGRTRLPFSMNMVNAKGEVEYCKIAYSIYPQVHPGLMMQKIAEATGLKLSKGNLALLNGYKNPMTPEQLKELKEEHLECHGLSYDENRNIYCNPADYKKHVERHGTCLVSLFRNPSTFTSGAWGQLVPMECVPVGCYWVNPTPEAFQWFFANQDGADLDDRMIMVMGELAISCILYHEGKKKELIARMLAPFKNRENPKTKAAREFIRLQTKFMLKEDMNVSMDADVKLNSEHISMVQDLTGDASTRVLQDMVSDRPLEIGLYSFKETAKQMQKAKYAFSKDTEVDHGSALANVASTIGSLELMKGTTGTAANVQMLMGAITQGLVDFGDGIDLDRKVRIISTSGYDELSESLTSEEFAELDNLTYRDLTFLIKSEMLSNVIDADTQGQNVPEAAEVMEMIWGVSMYLGIALFSGGKSAVQQGKNGTYVTINMISPDKMKFYFPGWLMKRGIGAFAAPFAGQSHMLQHGESSQGKKVNVRHFAFEETKFETANSWVFDIFEDYMDQVLGLAHDQIMATFNEGEAPAWQALELGLQSFSNEVAKARKACNELNELRRAGIMAVHRMGLEPKRRRVALTAVEQGWLAKWHAALPTEEGKLTFALWTLTQLVAAANEKRNDLTFTDRESFVSTSRRSYGSITVKGLPTHTLYVGNLLDAYGEAVTCERGLPQGPWLYVLKALNAMAVTPVTAKVDVFFNFTEEYKELKNWIMGMVNCKPGFALETKPCPEVKALMTTKDKFGVHNLDAEVYDNLHSGVVGKTLAEVLQSGLLTVGENKFIGKLNISKNGSTLINKSYSSWRDGSDDKHQDIKVFIEANNLHDYIVTGIEVVLETKATAKQYAYPSFSLTLKYNGPERPLQEINLSAYTETLKSKDSEQVDYTSGPIGYHTDVDFDNYDFDDLEDVVVEDFSYSEVIEAEVVEVRAEVEVVPELKATPATEPEVELEAEVTESEANVPQNYEVTVYQGRDGQSDGREFQYWAEDKEEAGDYGQVVVSRTIDLTGMLMQKSDDGKVVFREFCRLHKLKTGENFNLLSPGENSNLFFARLKAAGYTGISFLGSEENRYVVTFDGDGLV